jgi:electron transfer flavoprotein beta subunit
VNAVVLLKEILDWELPASRFSVDAETKRPASDLGPMLLGPFEQNALELVLKLRDAGVVDRITAVSVAPGEQVDGLRKALALRVDEAIQVVGDTVDPSQTAALLEAAIRRIGAPDLVVAGRQAGDWDNGQVGYLLAERLGLPCASLVFRAERDGDRLRVRRMAPSGVEELGVRPPAVLTVTSDPSLQLRMGSVMDRMAANKKPVERWELPLADDARGQEIVRAWVPEGERRCEMIEGADAAAVASAVLRRLEELKVLA